MTAVPFWLLSVVWSTHSCSPSSLTNRVPSGTASPRATCGWPSLPFPAQLWSPVSFCTFVSVFESLTLLPRPQKSMKKKEKLTAPFPHASEEQLAEKCKSLRKYFHIVLLFQKNLCGEWCAGRMETCPNTLVCFLSSQQGKFHKPCENIYFSL